MHKAFEKCAKEHLNNQEIRHKLYQRGLSEADFSERLEEVMFPSISRQKVWDFPVGA